MKSQSQIRKLNVPSKDEAVRVIEGAVEEAIINLQRKIIALTDNNARNLLRPMFDRLIQKASELLFGLSNPADDKTSDVLLPIGTRHICRKGTIYSILIEQEPSVRSLRIWDSAINGHAQVNKNSKHEIRSYSLPYVLFNFTFVRSGAHYIPQESRMGFSPTPLRTMEQSVMVPWLPNVRTEDTSGERGAVCVGGMLKSIEDQQTTPAEYIEKYLVKFWQSQFTCDLSNHIAKLHNSTEFTFKSWSAGTANDPSFVLKEKHGWYQKMCSLKNFTALKREDETKAILATQKAIKRIIDEEVEGLTSPLAEALDVDAGLYHPSDYQVKVIEKFAGEYAEKVSKQLAEHYDAAAKDNIDGLQKRAIEYLANEFAAMRADSNVDRPW